MNTFLANLGMEGMDVSCPYIPIDNRQYIRTIEKGESNRHLFNKFRWKLADKRRVELELAGNN